MEYKIASRHCRDQNGKNRIFHYYLTVDQIESPNFFFENYGVRIQEDMGTEACLPAITTSASRIDQLLTLLVDHCVGPSGLQDVVIDWIKNPDGQPAVRN